MAFFVGQKVLGYFQDNHMPEPMSGCWLWTGVCNDRGYGLIQLKQFDGYAHRFAYICWRGVIHRGGHICHKCDTPSCVNPDHLFLGSASDNMRDCVRKGRHASQKSTTKYAKGISAAQAKLTESEVREIRNLRGRMTQREIARAFGVTKTAIRLIHEGRTWRHV